MPEPSQNVGFWSLPSCLDAHEAQSRVSVTTGTCPKGWGWGLGGLPQAPGVLPAPSGPVATSCSTGLAFAPCST